MPLMKGKSRKAIEHNIKVESKTRPVKQAVAIAMRKAGMPKAAHKGKAKR